MLDLLILLGIIMLIPVAIYVSAINKWQARFIPESTIAFFVQGDSLWKIVPNIQGKKINSEGEIVEDSNDEEREKRGLLSGKYGVFWISLLWPFRRSYKFPIMAATLISESERAKKKMSDWLDEDEKLVHELRWVFERPFIFPKIELNDGSRVTMVVIVIFEVVKPRIPVFDFAGNFFRQLEAGAQGGTQRFGMQFSYDEFLRVRKGQGNERVTPPVEGADNFTTIINEIDFKQFGLRVRDSWVFDYEISEEDEGIVTAKKSLERERLLAEGARERGKGKAAEAREASEGEAERYSNLMQALRDRGATGDTAAGVVKEQVRAENYGGKDSSITTFVEGGGRAVVSVPSDTKPRNRED